MVFAVSIWVTPGFNLSYFAKYLHVSKSIICTRTKGWTILWSSTREPVSWTLSFKAFNPNFSSLNCSSNLSSGGCALTYDLGEIFEPQHPQRLRASLSLKGNCDRSYGAYRFGIDGSLIVLNLISTLFFYYYWACNC